MKKTLNVNVGGQAFVMDEDAYRMLERYLNDIGDRCEEECREETEADVEMRVADIFSENLSSDKQVVGVELVRRIMAVIGRPDAFGERPDGKASRPSPKADIRRLRRSRCDRVIAGVCGGLAQYFGLDVTLVRVLTFLLIFFGGVSLWVYIILWIAIPDEPAGSCE